MSYGEESYVSRNLVPIIFIPIIIFTAVFLTLMWHDFSIDMEQSWNEVYADDSCEELLWDKQWEEKKIIKDTLQLKVINIYMAKNMCK